MYINSDQVCPTSPGNKLPFRQTKQLLSVKRFLFQNENERECTGSWRENVNTVETRFNKPLSNKVLGVINNIHQLGQSYSKLHGTEPRYNKFLIITNTIQKPKRKIYLNILNTSIRAWVGILTFFWEKKGQISHPWDNIFGQRYKNSPPSGKQKLQIFPPWGHHVQ